MHWFLNYLSAYPVASLLQVAFVVWMLIDCRRREEVDPYWFWIILFVPFVGVWVYFFFIYLPNLKLGQIASWFQSRPSLDELRYKAEHQPTLINHVVLAQRLMEGHDPSEALPHLQAAQKLEPEHGLVLYTLAQCHVDLGNPETAVPVLEGLLARDPRWNHYSGWRLLAQARAAAGDAAGAAQTCRELARLSGSFEHKCFLAEYLLAAGETMEARGVLDNGLREHNFSPGPIRRRTARWARRARRLLKQTETGTAAKG